jgi:hypothetical protein
MNKKTAGSKIGISLFKAVLQVSIGKTAISPVIVEAFVSQIVAPPPVQMKRKIAVGKFIDIKAEELGAGDKGLF